MKRLFIHHWSIAAQISLFAGVSVTGFLGIGGVALLMGTSSFPAYHITLMPLITGFSIIIILLGKIITGSILISLRQANMGLVQETEERKHAEDEVRLLYEKLEQQVDEQTELLKANNALKESNDQIKQTLAQFQLTQDQLIISEKMAALGHLVAGIAHEINTPLGAMQSSIGRMSKALEQTITQLPDYFEGMTPNQRECFYALLKRSTENDAVLSAKDERKYKKDLVQYFEQHSIEHAGKIADTLIDIGIYNNLEPFMALFQETNSEFILQKVYGLSGLYQSVHIIQTATEKMGHVVQALKNYARGGQFEEWGLSNIKLGIETVITLYQHQLKQGIDLVRKYEEIPDIYCCLGELNQIWTNLLHNALYAMENKGTLEIQISQIEGNAVVRITDSGKGIPEEIKDKIFLPFFTTKPPGDGSGLGLDIVKKIVEKHKGSISFESKPGCTTFCVMLPIGTSKE
ncbi:MAG: GHKL domain-containing protein [SAR324 cluster bacterium]|nr:GHKL domain-containing protein [SAR324 cluster bacterium]